MRCVCLKNLVAELIQTGINMGGSFGPGGNRGAISVKLLVTLDQEVLTTLDEEEAVVTLGNETVLGAREVAGGSLVLPPHQEHHQVVMIKVCYDHFFQSY